MLIMATLDLAGQVSSDGLAQQGGVPKVTIYEFVCPGKLHLQERYGD